jgi:hypothetical protein
MSTITLALHETEPQTARSILNEMIRVTRTNGHLILVDYEISGKTHTFSHRFVNLVESFVGGDHYRNFRKFREMGGMDALIENLPVSIIEEIVFNYRGLTLRILKPTG